MTLAFASLALLVVATAALSIHLIARADERFTGFTAGINARLIQSYEVRSAVEMRAIGARDLVNARSEAAQARAEAFVKSAHQDAVAKMGTLQKMAENASMDPRARAAIAKIAEVESRYAPVALDIVRLAMEDKRDMAVVKMNTQCVPLLGELIQASIDYRDLNVASSRKLVDEARAEYVMQRNVLVGVCALAFVAAAVAGTLITRSLLASLGAEPDELVRVARRVADADLTADGLRPAPAGSVMASLQDMRQSLLSIVQRVRESSSSVATGSSQIAAGNVDLSQRTEQQSSSLQHTAASMQDLSQTVERSAQTAREASELAARAATAAESGGAKVHEVVATMREVVESSRRVADIVGVIDGIAFQTNILALNAAVEAARAGEQGRGFAVVASEVRSLAQRSGEAAREIRSMIASSVARVEEGAKRADEAANSMTGMVVQVKSVTDMIGQLAATASQQASGIGEVSSAVRGLDDMTQRNAALVEQTSAAAESLRANASELDAIIAQFKLNPQPL